MLNKNLLLGCAVAALTACGGSDLDLGPENPLYGQTAPTPAPVELVEREWNWDFSDASQLNDWADESAGNVAVGFDIHAQSNSLQILPTGWLENDDNLQVIGTLDAPVDLDYGKIYLSIYLPAFFTDQNPWNSDGDPGNIEDDRYYLGFQIPLVDSEGNRANATSWVNVFDLLGSDYSDEGFGFKQRKEDPSVGEPRGRWFDIVLDANGFADADEDFNISSVAGIGISMTLKDQSPDLELIDNEQYIFIDNVLLEPYVGDLKPTPTPTPIPTPIPTAAPGIPPVFGLPVYQEDVADGFTAYDGWGGSYTWQSSEFVSTGISAVKLEWAASSWGALQIAGSDQDPADYTSFHFSAYVPEGEADADVQVKLCDGVSSCDDNAGAVVTAKGGQWTHFDLPLADFPAFATVNEILVKNPTDQAKVVYVDDIGFDKAAPELDVPVYLDAVDAAFEAWGGWGGTYTFDSVETVKEGAAAVKLDWDASSWGALQIAAAVRPWDAVAEGLTTFNFSIYVPEGTGDADIVVQLCGSACADADGSTVTAVDGEWTDFSLPLSDFSGMDAIDEIHIKNATADAKVVYLDNMGFSL